MTKREVIVADLDNGHEETVSGMAELVRIACQFQSRVLLKCGERQVNAKSIMGILAFQPSQGMTVEISTEGSDEKEAAEAMEKFLICAE